MYKLVDTMRHLGDATSRNLEVSYLPDAPISYGEETITETNLLELWSRHRDEIDLCVFSKHEESKVGADWEWYIIGNVRTLAMRVQAKRVDREGVLRISYASGQTRRQQYDLLIESAQADNMRPMYCIYCTEPQRKIWQQYEGFQAGCLLTDAGNLSSDSYRLGAIEHMCWPWHLFLEPNFFRLREELTKEGGRFSAPFAWDGPIYFYLNGDIKQKYDRPGLRDNATYGYSNLTTDGFVKQIQIEHIEKRSDRGARGAVVIDTRDPEPKGFERENN